MPDKIVKAGPTQQKGQPVTSPGLGGPGTGGESSLQYGDVSRLRQGQRVAPLPAGTPPPRVKARPQGSPSRPGGIPPHLLSMADETPGEPTTAGLNMGAGPGSEVLDDQLFVNDIRERELMRLWLWYGNKDSFDLLNKLREERAATAGGGVPGGSPSIQPER